MGQSGTGPACGQRWGGQQGSERAVASAVESAQLLQRPGKFVPLTWGTLLRVSPREVLGTVLKKERRAFPTLWTSGKMLGFRP